MSSTQSTGLIEARLELAGHNEESVFIALEAIPRRGLGEAIHLRFRVFLAVLGVLHHVGESHLRLVGSRSEGVNAIFVSYEHDSIGRSKTGTGRFLLFSGGTSRMEERSEED